MEDYQNGRRPKWKTTKIEDDQIGRRQKLKTTKMEDDQNGGGPKWKTNPKKTILQPSLILQLFLIALYQCVQNTFTKFLFSKPSV